MQRLELWASLFAGASGGLFGMLWHGLVSAPWLGRRSSDWAARLAVQTLTEQLADAIVRATAGIVLGALFWASWGLIAFVRAPWLVVGVAFGILCWAGAALPALATFRAPGALVRPTVVVHAVEWLVTCVAVGLCCAYAWHLPR